MNDNRKSNIIRFPGTDHTAGALQVRCELLLMPLPVWRRFLVPGTATFWDLHVAIQDAMGWQDKHLHQFTLDDPVSGSRMRLGIPDDSGFYAGNEVLPGWEHRLERFMKPGSLPVLYTYDFGDEWQHEILLEAVLSVEIGEALPRCLAGEGVCPPEDCGGPPACAELVGSVLTEDFEPDEVVFADPRQRWNRAFHPE